MFEEESIGPVAYSPDGRSLAIVRTRAVNTLSLKAQSSLVDRSILADIWLQDGPGQSARNLTNGLSDESGAWLPVWSRDSQRLAFLSTRGGQIRLWAWERATNRIRQLSSQGIKHRTNGNDAPFVWMDERRILCQIPVAGDDSPPDSWEGEVVKRAMAAWTSAANGEVTASAINSVEFQNPHYRLFVVDTETGTGKVIATAAASWTPRSYWLSPDGKAVAFVSPEPNPYGFASGVKMGYPETVQLRFIDGRMVNLEKPLPQNIHTGTIAWSTNGDELAFFANGSGPVNPRLLFGDAAAEVMSERVDSMDNPAKLYRLSLADGRITQLDTGDMDLGELGAPGFVWTRTGELVFHTPRRRYGHTAWAPVSRGPFTGGYASTAIPFGPRDPREREDWWIVGRDGKARLLFDPAATVPTTLHRYNNGASFLGVSDGDIWEADLVRGITRNITSEFTPRITSIQAPRDGSDVATHVLATAAASDTNNEQERVEREQQWVVPLSGGEPIALTKPSAGATVVQFSPSAQSAVYQSNDRNGTYLWRAVITGQSEAIVVTNEFRKEIIKSKCQIVEYTSLHGETLRSTLCLPIGYVAGRRYPLVVHLYHGSSRGTRVDSFERLGASSNYYTAAGYAYLFATTRQNVPGMSRDEGHSLLTLTDGALPAVDRVISMGIADPKRLFVTGASWGGWSTLGIITQTNRFTAAVALANLTNLTFHTGGAIPRDWTSRYTTNPFGNAGPSGVWKGQRPSDVPWWRDGDRIRRNDSMSYVDRVQTPVMLIHGDVDPVDMTASEDYFQALVSQRKRAQLLRYWGEGHDIVTPANVRDKWRRVYAWFDEFGDILRDADGNIVFEGDRVKSRGAAPPLTPDAFSRFGPAAPVSAPRGTPVLGAAVLVDTLKRSSSSQSHRAQPKSRSTQASPR